MDVNAAQTRQQYLDKVASTTQPGFAYPQGASQYLADAQRARGIIDNLSGGLVIGTDGRPVVADGGELRFFQATSAQYNDSKLFLSKDSATLTKQFGSLDAATKAQADISGLQNRAIAGWVSDKNDKTLEILRTPSEGVEPVAPELYFIGTGQLAKSVASKVVDAGKAAAETLEGAGLGAKTSGSYENSLRRIVTDGEGATNAGTGSSLNVVKNDGKPQKFSNLQPADEIVPPVTFPANQIQSVGYSGKLNYVVTESGELIIGRTGHISLAQGSDVLAAGEVRFVNGSIRSIDNASGHYQPSGNSAKNAAEDAFSRAGFNPNGKYIEKGF